MLIKDVKSYLAVRRAAGFKLNKVERYLTNFAHYATLNGDNYLISKTAIDWANMATNEAQRHNRLKIIIRFALFIRAEDDRHEIPPDNVFCGQRQRPIPYIFTEEEIKLLILSALRLGPPNSLRPHTYSTLFGLFGTTGIRSSEALNLFIKDFKQEGLFIRETKFKKSRFIPLHTTVINELKNYLRKRSKSAGDDEHLFVSLRGRKISYTVVVETFNLVLKAAGIPKEAGRSKPHLHDLRHTFAVRSLEKCPDGRNNIRRHMLALSTYLGHARIESTYWYLESTPPLMHDISNVCESFMHGGAI